MVLSLDHVVPEPDVSERHALRIAAPPAAVWAALLQLRLADAPLSCTLMGLRMLPARLAGRRAPLSSGPLLARGGLLPVLGADPPRWLVAGSALQPWKLTGGARPPSLDADQLRVFDEPGWVTAACDFVLEPDGDGTLVRTETRVRATDARSRARFARYWIVVRIGSGLVRRDLLHAIARRATRLPT